MSCALGRLNAAGTATVTIPVRLDTFPAGGVATNTATVDVDPAKTGADDFPGGNNTGTAIVNVTRSSLAGTVFEDRDRAGANAGTLNTSTSFSAITTLTGGSGADVEFDIELGYPAKQAHKAQTVGAVEELDLMAELLPQVQWVEQIGSTQVRRVPSGVRAA